MVRKSYAPVLQTIGPGIHYFEIIQPPASPRLVLRLPLRSQPLDRRGRERRAVAGRAFESGAESHGLRRGSSLATHFDARDSSSVEQTASSDVATEPPMPGGQTSRCCRYQTSSPFNWFCLSDSHAFTLSNFFRIVHLLSSASRSRPTSSCPSRNSGGGTIRYQPTSTSAADWRNLVLCGRADATQGPRCSTTV